MSMRPPLYRDADMDDGPIPYECGCWIWEGVTDTRGTPLKRYEGRMTTAARALWQAENGPVPGGMVLASDCGTRLCVRPSHHSPVTRTEVAYRTGRARLNERLARRAYLASLRGMSERRLAEVLDVSPRTAGRIARGEYWALRGKGGAGK